jgi:hypothetical protein
MRPRRGGGDALVEKSPATIAVGVLVLSQYVEARYALRLLEHHPERVGYLLKERVSDIAILADALRRISDGECVIDLTIVSRLVDRNRHGPVAGLTERECDVLSLMAEGRSVWPTFVARRRVSAERQVERVGPTRRSCRRTAPLSQPDLVGEEAPHRVVLVVPHA